MNLLNLKTNQKLIKQLQTTTNSQFYPKISLIRGKFVQGILCEVDDKISFLTKKVK